MVHFTYYNSTLFIYQLEYTYVLLRFIYINYFSLEGEEGTWRRCSEGADKIIPSIAIPAPTQSGNASCWGGGLARRGIRGRRWVRHVISR